MEQNRSPATSAMEHINAELSGKTQVHVLDWLCRPKRHRRRIDLEHPDGGFGDIVDSAPVKRTGTAPMTFDLPATHLRRLTLAQLLQPNRYVRVMTNHVQGRVIIVTGAGGGFGRQISVIAASRGARIVAGDIDHSALHETIALITESGGDAVGRLTDVRDASQMDALVALGVSQFGRIDVLVNNAGTMPLAFFADHAQAREAWERCIDINFKGVLNGITAVHDQMIGQGRGQVINISSIYGNVATVGAGVYTATKAAVNVLSDTLRAESQGRIKVTNVKPTGVPGTGLGASMINGAGISGILGQNFGEYIDTISAAMSGELPESQTDPDSIGYWAITPEQLAHAVVHVIDQPWGISISDITVRASGDRFLF